MNDESVLLRIDPDALNVFEGALWRGGEIIRPIYAQHFRDINTGQECRATVRAGEYTWPGSYQLALVTSDGALLCFDCARKEYQQIAWSIRHEVDDGWRVIGCAMVEGGGEIEACSHCNRELWNPND